MMWLIEDKNLVGFDIFFLKFVLSRTYTYFKAKDAHTHTPRERERERLPKRERVLLAKNGNSDKSQDV